MSKKQSQWVVLIAAMLPMSLALEKQVPPRLSLKSWQVACNYGLLVLMEGIYFKTSTQTMFIINTATAVLRLPVLHAAEYVGHVGR